MGLDQWIFKMKSGAEPGCDDESVIYWRKANQIHGYMDSLFDGVEDCGNYVISINQLKDLKETCEQVLDNHSLAEDLLPPMGGFFFGSYEFDEYYFDDLKFTVKSINELIENDNGEFDYYYYAWW